MLQVIKAEDVRDGEPRWFTAEGYAAGALRYIELRGLSTLHTTPRDEGFDGCPLAIVDRPAPHYPPMPGTGAPRDPARIDPILARLRAAWHRSPDLRLGQLIVGSIRIAHIDRADAIRHLFNAECHEFGASGAPVEWPAPPTAQPPPVLDLDALERVTKTTSDRGVFVEDGAIYAYDGDACFRVGSAENAAAEEEVAAAIVTTLDAAPNLIAEARAAVALRQELAAMAEKLAEAKRIMKEAAEIERLTAELAAARAVPPDFEAAIKSTVDGAEEAGRCSALGHAYLITKAPFWTVPHLPTVGELLEPEHIVEFCFEGDWHQAKRVEHLRHWQVRHWRGAHWSPWYDSDERARASWGLAARVVSQAVAGLDPNARDLR